MPSAVTYIPPTDVARAQFSSALTDEITTRTETYKQALDYYMGKQEYPFPDDETQDSPDAVIVNMVKMAGDRTAEFLFPELPVFELDPETPEDTPEETWIKEFLEFNGGITSLTKLALRGFLSGHCFVQVKPVPEGNRSNIVKQYPRLLILDPTSVSAYWSADDVGDILWYEKRYLVGEDVYIQDFIKDGSRWLIRTFKSTISSNDSWLLKNVPTLHGGLWSFDFSQGLFEEVDKPALHNFSIAPIIEWPHLPHPDDRYGLGEFTEKALQDTINKIASARNRIVRENSEPTDVLLGADVDEIKDEGAMVAIPNPSAKVQRLEMKGDLTAISTVLKELIETYLAIARVVLLKGEAKDLQRVTNAAVRTLFLDMLAKNNLLQYAYGTGLIQVVMLALAMGKGAGEQLANPSTLKPKIKWASPLPTDLLELANTASILIGVGAMSQRTAATMAGLDWNFEQSAMKAEKAAAMEEQKAQLELQAEFAPKPAEEDKNSGLTQSKKPVE